ncbi:hypothetical protein F3157_21620 [Virgibacillus dakarensis]|uniref:Uncharacterized protein n=1 Tax=Lentibacillus populi TaxID=1827502 RepID=A0A9W5U2H2_9BACI|nr:MULTISPECIES: hypothetical protein [Bacillaceae]MBT2218367.1 hypothetical protein [Virgibacillus dakarensis]MTW88195.1 hypothetical protein [Virgibacillus dakarensis]GGB63065.1 hypothetical protein GCM10011409_45220 [Lentibacillus populi]
MLGLLINDIEQKEVEYLLKRELEELLMDLEDHRIDHLVKRAMRERYRILFQLFRRVASEQECLKYMPKRTKNE